MLTLLTIVATSTLQVLYHYVAQGLSAYSWAREQGWTPRYGPAWPINLPAEL